MTDVTNSWMDGEKPRPVPGDPTAPAQPTTSLVPDPGDRTAPAATAPAPEPKTFAAPGGGWAERPSSSGAAGGQAEEPFMRATVETLRMKAEELRVQARDWTGARGEQARDLIDQRPITSIATAFGVGVVLGALLRR